MFKAVSKRREDKAAGRKIQSKQQPTDEFLITQADAFRLCKNTFKERSLADIIEDGIGENVDGALVCHLAADQEWMALGRKCDEHFQALRAISQKPELPEEF